MEVAAINAVLGLDVKQADFDRAVELIQKVVDKSKEVGREGKHAGEDAAEGFGELREKIESVAEGLHALLGIEGLRGLAEGVEHVVGSTMKLQHLGERLGIPVDQMAGLDAAARAAGSSVEAVAGAVQRLEFGLHATNKAAGMHGAASALQKLGINVEAFRKLGATEQLAALADKFSQMADPNQKIAMAMQLGGRAMVELIPLLSKGRQNMQELAEAAKGAVLDPKKAEEYEDAQLKLSLMWDRLKVQIADVLIPVLLKLGEVLSAIMKFFESHPEALKVAIVAITAAVTALSAALAILTVRAALASLGFGKLGGVLGAVKNALLGVKAESGALGAVEKAGGGLLSKVGKALGIGRGASAAAEGEALAGGAVAEGTALAEGGAAAAEGGALAAGGFSAMSLLGPIAAVAGLGYGAYKLYEAIAGHGHDDRQKAPEIHADPADLEILQKAGYGADGRPIVNYNGDVHVTATVHADGASADEVADKFNEEMQNMIREAHKNMGGK